jgi:hypothetical protein
LKAFRGRQEPTVSQIAASAAVTISAELAMDLIFFPLLGLGPFAMQLGLGLRPALFSLGMMLTYSVVMGAVYGMIDF